MTGAAVRAAPARTAVSIAEIRTAIRAELAAGNFEAARVIVDRELDQRQAPALLFEALLVAARLNDRDLYSRAHPRFRRAVAEGFDKFPAARLSEIEAIFEGPAATSVLDDAPSKALARPRRARLGGVGLSDLRALAQRFGADGDLESLVRALRRLRRVDKLSAGQNRTLFRHYRRTGRGEVVDRYAERWLAAFSDGSAAQIGAINALWAAERLDDVLAVVSAAPVDAETLRNLALRCQRYSEDKLALDVWRRAAEIAPGHEATSAVVALNLKLGDPIAALECASDRSDGDLAEMREQAIAAIAEIAIESAVTRDLDRAAASVTVLEREAPGHEVLGHLRKYLAHLDDSHRQTPALVRAATASAEHQAFVREGTAPDQAGMAVVPTVALLRDAERGDWSVHFSALFLVAREAMEGERELRSSFLRLLDRADAPAGEPGPQIESLIAASPALALEAILRRFRGGDVQGALDLCLSADVRDFAATHWIEAADEIRAAGRADAASMLLHRACTGAPALEIVREAADRFDRWGSPGEAVALWHAALEREDSLRARLVTARYFYSTRRFSQALSVALAGIQVAVSDERLTPPDQNYLVQLVRLYVQAVWKKGDVGEATVDDVAETSALVCWVSAMFHFARHDRQAAVASLRRGLDSPPLAHGVALNLRAELALMHMRFNRFGEARRAIAGEGADRFPAHYHENLRRLDKVSRFLDRSDDYLYPEQLIDVIVDETARAPLGYAPIWGHVATVCGSLAAGGGERQAVTAVQRLVSHRSVSGQSLIVRTLEPESNAFFLPVVSALPIDLVHYGVDWSRRTDVARLHPALTERPRLAGAIDLLPHNLRENVTRVLQVILRTRPEVVHIRQDMYGAALACAIAGVPRYFVHRGSLSRNTWAHSPLQAEVQLRPMVHSYRRLLQTTDFFIVNNSGAGKESDQAWTEMHTDQFVVMPNAVDFDSLGANPGKNWELRRQLGIPDDAPVVGGAFRLTPVKRPLLWMDIARLVALERPDVHFLVIGEGDLRPQLEQFIAASGLGGRVHLPGAVADVGAWYRAMDLTLLTSDREGLPNALIESQHFGAPVVSAEVGGAAETMEVGVTGRLVDPNAGAGAFAAVILECLTDRAWFDRAVERGQAFVHERFAPAQIVEALVQLYGLNESPDLRVRTATYA